MSPLPTQLVPRRQALQLLRASAGDAPGIVTAPEWTKNGKRMTIPINAEIAGLLRDHRRATKVRDDGRVFPRVPNRHTWHRVLSMTDVRSVDERLRALTAHGARKWLGTELDRLGASPGIVALMLRHYQDLAQERYIDRLSGEARDFVERLPSLWPVDTSGVPQGPRTPAPEENQGKSACTTPDDRLKLCQPSGSLRVEHASHAPQCPLEDAKSVLKSVIETHALFLRIVARTMGSDGATGTQIPPT